jgi:extracellular elastinolytic metalloproteinase
MRSAVFATLASLAVVHAHPAAHGSRAINRRAIDLDAFRMVIKTEYKNATQVDLDPTIPTLRARATTEETATELVQSAAPGAEFRLVNDHYVGDNGVAHYYFKVSIAVF